MLGCDGANSLVRAAIGVTMEDLGFEQRWLVIDISSQVELDQWEGVHQVCDPHRAATYMRIGATRYRWEYRLLDWEAASDFDSLDSVLPLIGPWITGIPRHRLALVRVAEHTFRAQIADRWRDHNICLLGDAAHLTPPLIGQGLCAGLRDSTKSPQRSLLADRGTEVLEVAPGTQLHQWLAKSNMGRGMRHRRWRLRRLDQHERRCGSIVSS